MTDEFIFASRVSLCCLAFQIAWLSGGVVYSKAKQKKIDLAFWLALSMTGLALSSGLMFSWTAVYWYTSLAGMPEQWMLESPIIPVFCALMGGSAVILQHALNSSWRSMVLCFGLTLAVGIGAYIWVRFFL